MSRRKLSTDHAHPLVRQFFALIEAQRCPYRRIAENCGLHPQAFSWWKRRSNPTLPNFEAALNGIGYELRIAKREAAE